MFKHHFNSTPAKGEVNTAPSMTVPDQSLTIREIMQRYARGIPLDSGRVPMYQEDDEFVPDLERMDLAEIEAYLDDLKERITTSRGGFPPSEAAPEPEPATSGE